MNEPPRDGYAWVEKGNLLADIPSARERREDEEATEVVTASHHRALLIQLVVAGEAIKKKIRVARRAEADAENKDYPQDAATEGGAAQGLEEALEILVATDSGIEPLSPKGDR